MVSDKEQVASGGCAHDMEDAMIDAIGPPKLGPRKADGSADIEPSDVKEQIPGSRCTRCGREVPKNTDPPPRHPWVVFECDVARGQPCRVVAIPYRYAGVVLDGASPVERYVVERRAHAASMGEPVWKTVTDHAQLLTVIRALIEDREESVMGRLATWLDGDRDNRHVFVRRAMPEENAAGPWYAHLANAADGGSKSWAFADTLTEAVDEALKNEGEEDDV